MAAKLNLDIVSRSTARCWRGANHKNNDRTPSLSFDRQRNRARCFVCDPYPLSNIDLVMAVRGCGVKEAAMWIAANFAGIPTIKKGRHLIHRDRSDLVMRCGIEGTRSAIIRSGFLASLSLVEQSVLFVLEEFLREPAAISYRAIQRYSGIGSRSSISKAIKRFQQIGLLEVTRDYADGMRAINRYRFSPESASFQNLLLDIHEHNRVEIQTERELRREARRTYTGKDSVHLVDRGRNSRSSERTVNSKGVERIPVKPTHADPVPTATLEVGA